MTLILNVYIYINYFKTTFNLHQVQAYKSWHVISSHLSLFERTVRDAVLQQVARHRAVAAELEEAIGASSEHLEELLYMPCHIQYGVY